MYTIESLARATITSLEHMLTRPTHRLSDVDEMVIRGAVDRLVLLTRLHQQESTNVPVGRT